MIVLIWLGSGFAFAIGVIIGAWFLRSVSKPSENYDKNHAELLEKMEHRNDLLEVQNGHLESIGHELSKIYEVTGRG